MVLACIYSDAYGLEMNIDDEWPIDTILLAAPDLVDVITDETDVTSMGTVFAGASTAGDFASIVRAKGKFVALQTDDDIAAALTAGLSVILRCDPDTDLAVALNDLALDSTNLVVALNFAAAPSPAEADSIASTHRESLGNLGCADARMILCCDIDENTINNYLSTSNVDGVLLIDASFDTVNEILSTIAAG